jgi:hypothetical protein
LWALVLEIFIMYTITLNGNSSELSCDIFPPLEVDETTQICLLSLQTNNSIPNIEPGCNTIGFNAIFGIKEYITIPTGSYELNNLETTIQNLLPDFVTLFELKPDVNTLKCKMICSHDVDFTINNNISKMLGFKNEIYTANKVHNSDKIVNIMKVNCIKVECNLISGSFNDGNPSQTIHEFYPSVPPGYKIIEVPRHLVFHSLNSTSINKVVITLKDQNDSLINLREQPITIRLQIKHGYGA